jgi:UDP-N-acetylmuramate--alanine ligase
MRIHLIGIGGIGISGIAKYLHYSGHTISGSDSRATSITRELQELGIDVSVPHSALSISSEIDLIIHSAIIKDSNDEVVEAKKLGIKTLSRSEALPTILGGKKVFSVCGAHGKSTTTSILASIMEGSAIIGAYSREFGSNVRYSDSENIIFEADESDGSFLNSNPHTAIVTNAEPEHMEFYDYDLTRFQGAYSSFLKMGKKRVLNGEDPFLSTLDLDAEILYPSKDIRDIEPKLIDGEPYIEFKLRELGSFVVWGFGEHIAIDASLSILTALQENIEVETIRKRLLNYKGTKKRFDILEKSSSYALIDDYGHHPTEIEATLQSAFTYRKLSDLDSVTAIWQPHKYSRTVDNIEHFQSCFRGVDRLIILPVWRAGEEPVNIDFSGVFSEYNPLFASRIYRRDGFIEVEIDGELYRIDSGAVIGFGAGDITYQLRGEI